MFHLMLVALPVLAGCLVLYAISTFLRPYKEEPDHSDDALENDDLHAEPEKTTVMERVGEELGSLAGSIALTIIITPIILAVVGFFLYGLLHITNSLFPAP